MNPEHAQEFTDALGQVFEGAVRLADVAVDLNVPEALGLSTAQWTERRLVGPVRLRRADRLLVVAANPDLSSRELGAALDVDQKTIVNDRQMLAAGEENSSPPASNGGPAPDAGEENSSPDEPEERRLGFLMSSASDEWSTPQELYDVVHAEFAPQLDVCALPASAKCGRYFTPDDDGLSRDWTGVCWMNPPYGEGIGRWVAKAHESAQAGATVVCLVPARVDTGWWWDHCRHGEVRFLRGRLRFGGADTGAPFPSALVVFGRPARVVWWEWQP